MEVQHQPIKDKEYLTLVNKIIAEDFSKYPYPFIIMN